MAVECRVVTHRRLDLQQRSKLGEELAFDPRRAVEAANHARDDARERFGEDRTRQAGATPRFIVADDEPVALMRSGAGWLDDELCDHGSRMLFAKDGRQPFGRDRAWRARHIVALPCLGPGQTLEGDPSPDFQRGQSRRARCTHDPSSADSIAIQPAFCVARKVTVGLN